MTMITDNLLNDTLTLVQLAKETAQIRGQTKQVELLAPVANDLQTLVTSANQPKPTTGASPAPKIEPSSEIMVQDDFKTLLSVVQNNSDSNSSQTNHIFSSPTNDRNNIISAMVQGGMSILDISRQMGMTRDEVQMFISMTNPAQKSASGMEE
ncbi:MAG: hypothetical protein JW908_08345 [Anaerolineales bacterium]|nr:hypothetical protein [Anaerolineales bacterium]